jgi:ech hydrogenase subunit A
MSTLVLFLIGAPLLASGVLLFVTHSRLRDGIVVAACTAVGAATVAAGLRLLDVSGPVFFGLPGGAEPGHGLLALDVAIALFVVGVGLRYRRVLAPVLALVQLGLLLWLDLRVGAPETAPDRLFAVDRLSLVMVLIVGVIGTLICTNALGYMRDYQRRYPLIAGRRTSFFFLLFLFLAAMFGLVCANDLPLLFLFWEVTTLCSFLLIGYTRTRETVGYAFTALNMNLLGGLGFALAMLLLARAPCGLDLARLTAGPAGAALLPAVALLCLAGITKSAQMPFSSWLLGAMYAPSPTSALLHSSTMVKAGVFLLLRLSPAMAGSPVGTAVAMVGLATFLAVSLVATTERNAKKVLAYSTIGNLGLVVGCAGVATPETVWVGVMIVIFHALAKSLLFLVVGTLENRLYTKDLESFDTLLSRLPNVSLLALVGVCGMFIAPFGIVIAKWSAIRALLEVPGWPGAAALVVLAFGSACTIFYWAKLLIKVLSTRDVEEAQRAIEQRVSGFEWFSERVLGGLVLGATAGIGFISDRVVGPLALAAFGAPARPLLHVPAPLVAVLLLAVLAIPAMALWARRRGGYEHADIYASGRTVSGGHVVTGALDRPRAISLRGYYLEGVVDGPWVFRAGTVACGAILAVVAFLEVVRP